MKNNILLCIKSLFCLFLILLFNVSEASTYLEIAEANITEDTVWTEENSPYVIQMLEGVVVHEGATLTLEPGTIVKFDTGVTGIHVFGSLDAQGTPDKKIYFTHLFDDSIGGDTDETENGESDIVDYYDFLIWEIGFNSLSATSSLSNVVLKHTNGEVALRSPLSYAFENVEIEDLKNGMVVYGGEVSIVNSTFKNNKENAIVNKTKKTINAQNNWWNSESGPYHIDLNPHGTGDSVVGDVSFEPWLKEEPVEATIDPVIVIPGFFGSALKNGIWQVDPIFHVYDNLVESFVVNGYVLNTNLFTFPYDWREKNSVTADMLKQKIDEVKEICECKKVDFVAHSMGGLVARHYIQSEKYENDVDQLIFLGTPHLGAPKTYLTWEAGESEPDFIENTLKVLLENEGKKLGYKTLFDYVRLKPLASIREMLPIFDYIEDNASGNMRKYPIEYPRNTFLESLNANVSLLYDSGVRITNITGDVEDSTTDVISVVPSYSSTIWEHGYPYNFDKIFSNNRGLKRGAGDGTVPSKSSQFVNKDVLKTSYDHISLPTETQEIIFTKLTGKIPENVVYKKRVPDALLVARVFSPVDIEIISPSGKSVGWENGSDTEVNEIEGAFYSGNETDNEYITIPNPEEGEYNFRVKGTDQGGDYALHTSYISESGVASSTLYSTIVPDEIREFSLLFEDNGTTTNIELKQKKIVDTKSMIEEIERVYALGWIKSRVIKDFLIKMVLQYDSKMKKQNYAHVQKGIFLNNMSRELDLMFRKKRVNKSAYIILKEQILSLKNK